MGFLQTQSADETNVKLVKSEDCAALKSEFMMYGTTCTGTCQPVQGGRAAPGFVNHSSIGSDTVTGIAILYRKCLISSNSSETSMLIVTRLLSFIFYIYDWHSYIISDHVNCSFRKSVFQVGTRRALENLL
jgi:hypothetical protein